MIFDMTQNQSQTSTRYIMVPNLWWQ